VTREDDGSEGTSCGEDRVWSSHPVEAITMSVTGKVQSKGSSLSLFKSFFWLQARDSFSSEEEDMASAALNTFEKIEKLSVGSG
jgi:hypothetical protein